MRVNDRFDYADAIKASLRLNPKWIMLSEARSKEVKYLLEGWSTGVRGMTTPAYGRCPEYPRPDFKYA